MIDDADTVLERVAAGGLLAPGRPVLVLLSGGRDSVCLLHLAVSLCGAARALHVNYGLRAAAGQDERHCRALCEQLGVQLEIVTAGDDDIAAGHTATDQVETILYRLASSPSRRALLGMRPREGQLVRPLLGVTREETAAYCRARGLEWREDESNDSDRYARGRVRHGLVAALREVHPAAEANVLALAELLRGEAEVLDELVDGVLEGRSEVSLTRLRSLPPALARLVVQRLADEAVGGPAAGVGRRAEEVAAMRDGSALDLPRGVRATARDGSVTFEAAREPIAQRRRNNRRA